jgi:tryptophan halogenase
MNVVGVGLSYGFIEPLESTGLLTTHENIIKLVETLNRREGYVTRSEREGFNFAVQHDVLRFRDFVSQHYALSKRTDTPYWRWCTQINEYQPEMMGDYMLQQGQYPNILGNIVGNSSYPADYVGNMFIAAGMGVKSISTKELIYYNGSRQEVYRKQEEIGYTKRRFEEYRDFVIEHVKKLPSHYEFLKNEIYGGVDEHL